MAKRAEKTPPLVTKVNLHPKQKQFSDSQALYRAFVGGLGSGKTTVGCYDLLRRAQPKCLYMVVSPTFRMLEDATLRTFVEQATKLGLWNADEFYRSDMRAVLTNKAEVLFRSGDDPAHLRGPNLSGGYLDEAGLMQEEVFHVMIGRLRQGGKQGWLSVTFTPQSPDHWTRRIFAVPEDPSVALIHCHTQDNFFLPKGFVENLLKQYGGPESARARRELGGEFVYLEGAEWPPEWFGTSIWFDDWPPDHKGLKVIALDSSKGKGGKTGDYSAFVKVQYYDGIFWIDADMRNDRNAAEMAQTAVEMQVDWKPAWFVVEEEFGGAALLADMHHRADDRQVIMPVIPLSSDKLAKEVRIRRLTPHLADQRCRFKSRSPGAKLLVDQLTAFPQGEHDDGPDALEMAIRVLSKAFGGQILPPIPFGWQP